MATACGRGVWARGAVCDSFATEAECEKRVIIDFLFVSMLLLGGFAGLNRSASVYRRSSHFIRRPPSFDQVSQPYPLSRSSVPACRAPGRNLPVAGTPVAGTPVPIWRWPVPGPRSPFGGRPSPVPGRGLKVARPRLTADRCRLPVAGCRWPVARGPRPAVRQRAPNSRHRFKIVNTAQHSLALAKPPIKQHHPQ